MSQNYKRFLSLHCVGNEALDIYHKYMNIQNAYQVYIFLGKLLKVIVSYFIHQQNNSWHTSII